ncbi:MAG TPA: L,D-transpeptidase [Candidatus Saccharimonadales bacterium]|nr:L,D-transpeptidase [Candidatus Saccharimonadales bacterium]
MLKIKILILILVLAAGGLYLHQHHETSVKQAAQAAVATAKQKAQKVAADELASHCKLNTSDKEIVVSISKQHLWACAGPTTAYDSAVITGMQMYPSELTPVGTYHIYSKLTDQTLSGSDFTGHWSDYVNYWMPFLDNQYGTYGFHDLTQASNGTNGRADSDFGHVDINAPFTAAKHGSHGCVELPLATAKWLYNWSSVGTTVVVQS